MNTKRVLVAVVLVLAMAMGMWAAAPKTYQVTGPILEVKDDYIVVQKDSEKWQIARTPDTKITGDLKVGAKVTIQYFMTATAVGVKDAAAPAKAPSKATGGKTKG